jgi:hypothetical protein
MNMARISERGTVFVVTTVLTAATLAACATIMHGTTQDVGLSSMPTGATVSVDDGPKGQTPLITKLSRKDNHVVKIEMPGYQPYEATVTRSVSGWVWGNIVFGGLIGLAVDAVSGGIYKLSPEQLQGTLATQNAEVGTTKDGIYIAVVLQASSDWIKVAQLDR